MLLCCLSCRLPVVGRTNVLRLFRNWKRALSVCNSNKLSICAEGFAQSDLASCKSNRIVLEERNISFVIYVLFLFCV